MPRLDRVPVGRYRAVGVTQIRQQVPEVVGRCWRRFRMTGPNGTPVRGDRAFTVTHAFAQQPELAGRYRRYIRVPRISGILVGRARSVQVAERLERESEVPGCPRRSLPVTRPDDTLENGDSASQVTVLRKLNTLPVFLQRHGYGAHARAQHWRRLSLPPRSAIFTGTPVTGYRYS